MRETVIVGTGDFRQALGSVRVHASTDKEDPTHHRIRLQFGRQHLTVSATDRYTGALAIVSLWGDPPPGGHGLAAVELLPDDVGKLLAIFKGGKGTQGDGITPEQLLRLEVLPDRLRITDCSGMIDGRALQLPRLSAEQSASFAVVKLIEQMQRSQATNLDEITVTGEFIGRFREAAKTYGAALKFEGHGTGALFARCGESFLGYCTARELDRHRAARASEYSRDWSYRLPGLLDEANQIENNVFTVSGEP
ncbi:hypothetical protein [Nocardia sp. CNY236]|uniref:hypothetical protein n=1 Tax=Nocardia sp. CNY236 TaxID=1169152 RepID=UPI0004163285|nr:hypothetical protein [Nocardia sp. CNY236]